MKLAFACAGECVFVEVGLLNADKKVDKAAAIKYFSQKDASITPQVTAAAEKCFGSYEADVDSSLECKSGADEFQRCMLREIFLHCPGSLWSATPECNALKTKVAKCPMMPFMMGGPGKPTE